jgi:hypothetical protein
LKKAAQKLWFDWEPGCCITRGLDFKSLFGSFSSEKELLTYLVRF